MALRAGYYGLKRALIEKVKVLPGFSAIGTGLQINNDGELEVTGATTTIDPNPEGDPTESLEKLQIGDTIYGVNDNTKCYQTDDDTEVTIVDADYVPFYDASASAPKKSTWSNFISKIKAKITEYVTWSFNARTGVHNILDPDFNPPSFSSVDDIVTLNNGILTLNGTRASSTNYAIKDRKTGAKVIYLPKGTYTYYALGADWENGVQVGTTYNNSFVSIAQSGSANDRVTFTVDDNTPSDFKLADGSVLIGLYVKILLGTYSNKVIKPMLCSGNDPIATYASFAMTNRELTENKLDKLNDIISSSSEDINNYTKAGIWGVTEAAVHAPENQSKGMLIVYERGDGTIYQTFYKNNVLYQRVFASNSWTNWFKFTGTELT